MKDCFAINTYERTLHINVYVKLNDNNNNVKKRLSSRPELIKNICFFFRSYSFALIHAQCIGDHFGFWVDNRLWSQYFHFMCVCECLISFILICKNLALLLCVLSCAKSTTATLHHQHITAKHLSFSYIYNTRRVLDVGELKIELISTRSRFGALIDTSNRI